jgi:hypothetical protein
VKTFLSALAAMFAFAALSFLSPAQAQYQQGQCARLTNGGRLETILGPSNVDGQWMVRDARLSEGTGQSLRPEQFAVIPCPGAPVGQECFESTPDTAGHDADQQQVIHVLRTSMERVHKGIFRLRITALDVGAPRAPSYQEGQDILNRDPQSAVVDVHATFDTCADDGAMIRTEHHEQRLMCYNTYDKQGLTCGSIYNPDVVAPDSQEIPKFPDQP